MEPTDRISSPGQEIASDYPESLHVDFMQRQNGADDRSNGGKEIGDQELGPSNNENDQFLHNLFATMDSFCGYDCFSIYLYYSEDESPPRLTQPQNMMNQVLKLWHVSFLDDQDFVVLSAGLSTTIDSCIDFLIRYLKYIIIQ